MLNKEQKIALEVMQSGKNVFLSGEAGTGKSYLLNHFLESNKKKNILVCAPTGIAAINVNGSTLHRTFRIPFEPLAPDSKPTSVSRSLEKADIIVIDEISMCRFDQFDYVAKCIRQAEKQAQRSATKKCIDMGMPPKKLPPKQVILIGDFFQLPPVITPKDREVLERYWGSIIDINDGFAFQAPMWKDFNFTTIILKTVMRQQGNLEFVTNLNKLRKGDESAIAWFNTHAAKKQQDGIHLCCVNRSADQINHTEAEKLNTLARTYQARIEGSVSLSEMPTPDILNLKIGMQVMSLVNDPNGKYQNGTVGTITGLRSNSVTVDFDGEYIDILPFKWEIIDYAVIMDAGKMKLKKVIAGIYEQIPLKIAYAITIHKSQGQTYDAANIDPNCFAAGQLYVGLSRVRSIENLHLTELIKKKNLITSQSVIDFYNIASTLDLEKITEKSEEISRKTIHGGVRSGAGRKYKYGTKTCTIRIPESAKEAVLEFLASREWD